MISHGVPDGDRPKGKAVEIHHHLFDALWNIGNRQIDASILLPKEGESDLEQQQQEESKQTDPVVSVQQSQDSVDNQDAEEEKKATGQQEEEEVKELEEEVPVEEMDSRILEAFYRSLLESVQDKDLPLEPCDFMKNNFAEYSCDDFRLDLRKSSFKKIGKLLDQAARDGMILYVIP